MSQVEERAVVLRRFVPSESVTRTVLREVCLFLCDDLDYICDVEYDALL